MNIEPKEFLTATVAVLAPVGGCFVWLFRVANRIGRLELQVETMWGFLTRRARVDGEIGGLFSVNSPIALTDKGRALLGPLGPALKALYLAQGANVSDKDFMLIIERELGERLVREVCVPHNYYAGACLIAALCLAKELAGDSRNKGI